MLSREAIWKALAKKGIPNKLITIIRAMYEGSYTRIIHNNQLSPLINTTTGVKQGCPLSPLLFITTLDEVLRKACQIPRGIQWGQQTRLESLEYADDIALLTHTARDMKEKLRELQKHAGEVGLQINTAKTKVMKINTSDQTMFYINDQVIEEVSTFSYLGSVVSTDGGTAEDICSRIAKAGAAFASMWPVWRSSQISRNLKLRIFNACVKSILLYGSETWSTRKIEINKIQVFVNKCLRIICRVFWPNRIRNEDLWKITEQEPMEQQIKRRKWRFIGHTLRRPNSITKQALEWTPQGHRKVGRPTQTWRRSLRQDLGTRKWNEVKPVAANRVRWKALVDALCS